jgi:hypothetical protein
MHGFLAPVLGKHELLYMLVVTKAFCQMHISISCYTKIWEMVTVILIEKLQKVAE